MDPRLAFDITVTAFFIAVHAAIAVLLLAAGFNRTANRALALTILLNVWAAVFLGILSNPTIAPSIGSRWIFYARHAWFLDTLVIFAFLANYPAKRERLPRWATQLWPYIALGLIFSMVQIVWPQMGIGNMGTGPLGIPDFLADAFAALVVPLILLAEVRRGRFRNPLGPVFLAGFLPTYFIGADLMSVLSLLGLDVPPWLSSRGNLSAWGFTAIVLDVLLPLRFLLGLALLASVAWTAYSQPRLRSACVVVLAVLIGHIAVRLFFMLQGSGSNASWAAWTLPLQLASIGFLGYIALHDQSIGLNRRIRIRISRAAVATTFLAVFFVVTQVMQNALSEEMGYIAGGVVAGALLFAVAPLQRVAERVARVDGATGDDRVVNLYREAVELTLVDRAISPREERHLAHLAERLGLAAGQAMEIRLEVQDRFSLRATPQPVRTDGSDQAGE